MASLRKRPLFNPEGDIDVTQRRLIGGNTTNMNDFNNLKVHVDFGLVPPGDEQLLDP